MKPIDWFAFGMIAGMLIGVAFCWADMRAQRRWAARRCQECKDAVDAVMGFKPDPMTNEQTDEAIRRGLH